MINKERGIIFNGEMVRAILDGRKTKTRRVIKNQPAGDWPEDPVFVEYGDNKFKWKSLNYGESAWFGCPFGKVGDRLWVRETFTCRMCTESTLAYRATHKPSDLQEGWYENIKWTPSIHMPRWASRITLEITDIRVERLHAIALGDICKEIGCGLYDFIPATHGFLVWEDTWILTHGQDSWQSNPWVWVIEFKRVDKEVL